MSVISGHDYLKKLVKRIDRPKLYKRIDRPKIS